MIYHTLLCTREYACIHADHTLPLCCIMFTWCYCKTYIHTVRTFNVKKNLRRLQKSENVSSLCTIIICRHVTRAPADTITLLHTENDLSFGCWPRASDDTHTYAHCSHIEESFLFLVNPNIHRHTRMGFRYTLNRCEIMVQEMHLISDIRTRTADSWRKIVRHNKGLTSSIKLVRRQKYLSGTRFFRFFLTTLRWGGSKDSFIHAGLYTLSW